MRDSHSETAAPASSPKQTIKAQRQAGRRNQPEGPEAVSDLLTFYVVCVVAIVAIVAVDAKRSDK